MIFSIIASIFLILILVLALILKNQYKAVSIFIGFFAIFGIYFVWDANSLNIISQFMGIGRGADLLLYIWVLVTLAIIFVLFLRVRILQENITKLARHIALAEAKNEEKTIK